MKTNVALLLLLVTVVPCTGSGCARVEPTPWKDLTVVVTGANRGIGLALARELHDAGAYVIATARRPEEATELQSLGVQVEQLDVTDPQSIARLATALGDRPVDALLNNAGIFPSRVGIEEVDLDGVLGVYEVNVVGPMRMTQALLPNLRRGHRKLIMNMSSYYGSIANNRLGKSTGYRESKAAVNMFTRSLAAELKDEGFTCIAMNPGWVRTDMGGPDATLSPEQSAKGILAVLARKGPRQSGRYFDYEGRELDW